MFACDCVVWREAYQNLIFNNNFHCPPDWRTVSHVFHGVFFFRSPSFLVSSPSFLVSSPHPQILKSDAAAMPRWNRSSGAAAAAATAAVCLEHIASHLSHHPHKLINLGSFCSVRCGGIFSTTRDLHFFLSWPRRPHAPLLESSANNFDPKKFDIDHHGQTGGEKERRCPMSCLDAALPAYLAHAWQR